MVKPKKKFTAPRPELAGVYMVSLGCPKNLVDSEVMAGTLITGNVPLNFDDTTAKYYLINTCAFLPSAREESYQAIREGIAWKKHRAGRKLLVAGCLIQWDKNQEFLQQFPEVDFWSGIDGVPAILETLEKEGGAANADVPSDAEKICCYHEAPDYLYDENTPRLQLTAAHVAFLKISDGCDNRCSYCSIPNIRGTLRSRSIPSVIAEAKNLLNNGVKELVVIAQDVTRFGADNERGETLAQLLREMEQLPGDFWIRLLYTHPAHYTDELIEVLAHAKKVLPYLDIPLQHINNEILRKMGRKASGDATRALLSKLRQAIPDLTLRTTFITGLPGEGEAEFDELRTFVREQKFERLGVFAYSPEPSTPAATFPDQVPTEVAQARADELMTIQREISLNMNRSLLGKVVTVIADQTEGKSAWGRMKMDAPEIDDTVFFEHKQTLKAGKFYSVKITGADEFDLTGIVC